MKIRLENLRILGLKVFMGRGPVISAKEIDWHLKITASYCKLRNTRKMKKRQKGARMGKNEKKSKKRLNLGKPVEKQQDAFLQVCFNL